MPFIRSRNNPTRVALAATNLAIFLALAAFSQIMAVPSPDVAKAAFSIAPVFGVFALAYWITRRRRD